MKGDFSRLTFDPAKQYSRVLMQQGRVQLDADWNEQGDIFLHTLRTLAADLIGPFGGPEGALGFEIKLEQAQGKLANLTIGEGRYYVDGLLGENPQDEVDYYKQPYLTVDPNDDKLPAPPLLVYLDVWERHITYLVDDGIREVALGGPDTATRAQVVWQVRVTENDPEGKQLEENAEIEKLWPDWLERWQPADRGRLKARAKTGGDSTDPCLASPDARFRGAENQLYRVEIQWQEFGEDGRTSATVAFKWSRDNGSVVFAVRDLEGRVVHLESLGRDEASGLKPGDWVEFVNDDSELAGPGPLLKVEEIDTARRSVTLASPAEQTDPDLPSKPGDHALLRRWDHHASPRAKNGPSPRGAVVYQFGDLDEQAWLDLEDGIQIQLQPGSYRSGDYWLIPARTATGDVEWPGPPDDPQKVAPHGVQHHFAPLAFVKSGTAQDDLRKRFAGLAQ